MKNEEGIEISDKISKRIFDTAQDIYTEEVNKIFEDKGEIDGEAFEKFHMSIIFNFAVNMCRILYYNAEGNMSQEQLKKLIKRSMNVLMLSLNHMKKDFINEYCGGDECHTIKH